MRRLSPLLRGPIIMTAGRLFLRLIGIYFQSEISKVMGAEGMGLLTLGMNVEALAVTLGTSGIHYSTTRLLSEELGLERPERLRSTLRCCLGYALLFGSIAAVLLCILSPTLSRFAGDERLRLSFRCFAAGIPFLALNAVFTGYFVAVLTPWKGLVSQTAEQILLTVLTLLLLRRVPSGRPDLCCAVVAASGAAADLLSLLLSYILYIMTEKRRFSMRLPSRVILPRLLRLSLPLALSSYARTALSSLQHLLVPKALRRSGYDSAAALAVYGTVSGMVFPVLTFASVFFGALSEMLIPKLTDAQMRGDRAEMERSGGRILSACLLFSAAVSLLLYLFGPWLGQRLYQSKDAGTYIRVLSPLVTVMYLDSVVDGMLKGLGLQLNSMKNNLIDAALTLCCVCTLLPRFGTTAYIGILYFSECFNFLLSFLRLRRNLTIRFL